MLVPLVNSRLCDHSRLPFRDRKAFTLVELLVVIAIIGVLVALLLPAVQSAREAARRSQCLNNLKQVGLAVLNLESTLRIYPTGGVAPWPAIENYSSDGRPFGPKKQGLSWAFQILPYLEQGAIQNLTTTTQLQSSPVSMYFCPSRRSPQQNLKNGAWLMDYAGLTAAASRAETPGPESFEALLAGNHGCERNYGMWGTVSGVTNDHNPRTAKYHRTRYAGFFGVFIRTSYFVNSTGGAATELGYGSPTTIARVEDGTSNTAMVTEKHIRIDLLEDEPAWDDRGWSDGWDYDTMKSGLCQPLPDDTLPRSGAIDAASSGSAHVSVLNVLYADGSVHAINFDVDLETWNNLAHRSDGAVTSP